MSFNAVLITFWCIVAYKCDNILWDCQKKKPDQMTNVVTSKGACAFLCPSIYLLTSFCHFFGHFGEVVPISKVGDLREGQNCMPETF